jgi:hypothetical protein
MIVLLIIYFIFLIGFIIFSILGLYHLWKFGFQGDMCKIVMITYSIVSGLIILFSLIVILSLNWHIRTFPNFGNLIPKLFGG